MAEEDHEQDNAQCTAGAFAFTPRQGTSVPHRIPGETRPRCPRPPNVDLPSLHDIHASGPSTPTQLGFPTARLPPVPFQTSNPIDHESLFARTDDRATPTPVLTTENIKAFVRATLIDLKKSPDDEEVLQKMLFDLIRECRLTYEVYQTYQKQFKLASFSKIKWTDVCHTIHNLSPSLPNTYVRIPTFPLRRARIPMNLFEGLVTDFNRAINRVGCQSRLVNEAGVHEYVRPVSPLLFLPLCAYFASPKFFILIDLEPWVDMTKIFDFFQDIFRGGIINAPEITLEGTTSSGGRCEYNFVFLGSALLVLVELKFALNGKSDLFLSNVVAQVFAESEGTALHNQFENLDAVPVHAILTDGSNYYFFVFDFRNHSAYRGVTDIDEGYFSNASDRIKLPFEADTNFLLAFKGVAETIFNMFLHCYLNAIVANIGQFKRHYGEDALLSPAVTMYRCVYNDLFTAMSLFHRANSERSTLIQADNTANSALQMLSQCLDHVPHQNPNQRIFLDQFNQLREKIGTA